MCVVDIMFDVHRLGLFMHQIDLVDKVEVSEVSLNHMQDVFIGSNADPVTKEGKNVPGYIFISN